MQVVILQSRYNEDEWCVRVQRGSGLGRYLKLAWRSLEAARLWTERSIARNKAMTMFVARLLVSAILLAFIAPSAPAQARGRPGFARIIRTERGVGHVFALPVELI